MHHCCMFPCPHSTVSTAMYAAQHADSGWPPTSVATLFLQMHRWRRWWRGRTRSWMRRQSRAGQQMRWRPTRQAFHHGRALGIETLPSSRRPTPFMKTSRLGCLLGCVWCEKCFAAGIWGPSDAAMQPCCSMSQRITRRAAGTSGIEYC